MEADLDFFGDNFDPGVHRLLDPNRLGAVPEGGHRTGKSFVLVELNVALAT